MASFHTEVRWSSGRCPVAPARCTGSVSAGWATRPAESTMSTRSSRRCAHALVDPHRRCVAGPRRGGDVDRAGGGTPSRSWRRGRGLCPASRRASAGYARLAAAELRPVGIRGPHPGAPGGAEARRLLGYDLACRATAAPRPGGLPRIGCGEPGTVASPTTAGAGPCEGDRREPLPRYSGTAGGRRCCGRASRADRGGGAAAGDAGGASVGMGRAHGPRKRGGAIRSHGGRGAGCGRDAR